MQKPIQLLAIVPDEWLTNLRDALAGTDVDISTAHDWQSAVSILRTKAGIKVVLTASMLPDATWKEVLSDASHLRRPPQVIVAARYRDSGLWYDVLGDGGYDLVAYPFESDKLPRTVISASAEYTLERDLPDGAARYHLEHRHHRQ